MIDIIVAVIGSITSLTVIVFQIRVAKNQKAANVRALRREEESRLSMALMGATCSLGIVTAKALTNQKLNGNVEEAMEQAEDAQKEYQGFLQRVTAASVAKI